MGLLRPHRAVAPAPRAPTDARGDHARPPRILRLFRQLLGVDFALKRSGHEVKNDPPGFRPYNSHVGVVSSLKNGPIMMSSPHMGGPFGELAR